MSTVLAAAPTAPSSAVGHEAADAAPAVTQGSSTGSVTAFGDATALGAPTGMLLDAPVVGIAGTPDGRGYWLVAADGGVFTAGDAGFYGSGSGKGLLWPFVGIAPTRDGHGYWLADLAGLVYAFGDAPDEGSIGVFPAAPVVGIAATPDGRGYWLVAADGGVFTAGDAAFYGSMGGRPLNAQVVGITATPDGGGYWLVAADGGVFGFGDAAFYGSMGGEPPGSNTPVVGMAPTPDGRGYLLVTTGKELPTPTPVPSVLAECDVPTAGPSVEPPSIILACGDGSAFLTHLVWSSWTPTTALASGNYTHNTCTPDCALGVFVSAPATIRLGYPVETSGGREFAMIGYAYVALQVPSSVMIVAPTSPG